MINEERLKQAFLKIKQDINQLRKDILKGSVRTELRTELRTEPNVLSYVDNKVFKKYIQTKPELIKRTMLGLIDDGLKTKEIEDIIVKEKKLCGRTSFYNYLGIIKGSVRTELRTEHKIFK